MNRQQLLQILGRIQNSTEFARVDIMTITACRPAMDVDQLTTHVMANFARLSDAEKRDVLQFTRDLKVAA